MPRIWANYLTQQTTTSVVPSAGWVNVGDVLQRRGSSATSVVKGSIMGWITTDKCQHVFIRSKGEWLPSGPGSKTKPEPSVIYRS